MDFFKEKLTHLQKYDLSRKGSIDTRITDVVKFINEQNHYFTTSSCSGRTIIFTNSEQKKRGCKWIFVSHDIVSEDEIIDTLHCHTGSAILKFEPFVLHTQCCTLEDAQKLLNFGIEAGFKNSGISIGKRGKIIVAIRNTLTLEVPLSSEGTLLVSNEYITFLVKICNEKMLNNWQRIERFFTCLQKLGDEPKKNSINKIKPIVQVDQFFNQDHCKEVKSVDVPLDTYYEGFHNLLNCN